MTSITIMISIMSVIFGLLIGSFLNVCIYRIPREESIAFPPSHCTNCNSEIKRYDLIPVISYIFLKGRCRNCKAKISIRYPIIELITSLLFLAVYIKFGLSFELIKYLFFIPLMIVICMIDFDTFEVYFTNTIFGVVTAIIFIFIYYFFISHSISGSLIYIYGGLLGGGVIGLIVLLTLGRAMGAGDIEVSLVSGLYLGFYKSIVMLMLSVIIGGIYAAILMIFKRKGLKSAMPFAPCICAASVITVFFGQFLINWYMGILGF